MSQPQGAHLVGSVPMDTTEEVLRAAGENLRGHLRRVPDGETGEREGWVAFQAGVFARHPDITTVPRGDGGYAAALPTYQLRDGADPAGIDLRPLGYADAAEASYRTFRQLREQGVLGERTRFLVSLPTPVASVASFVTAADQPRLEPAYQAALFAEMRRIQNAIPAADLAIQCDVAVEVAMWEGLGGIFTPWFEPVREGTMDRIGQMMAQVDEGVELGVHLCYGDYEHRHYVQPKDTAVLTELGNGLFARATRPLNWLHLPVPKDRDDDAYFAPLAELRLPAATELYLGLVHADDTEGTRRRITTALGVRPRFGVATECGMGRTPRAEVPGLFRQLADVSAAW
ncbi:hypothetical protein GCM10023321_09010 [Pseudonocardia eucalypti]|uniref:5-methyltetrahydropteroyltriglutamate--homocysteine methyltransferase n=1 Tax=Pseudonocardia eucalypti TaxID=648755 RepID=A0ABP9PJM4_9PSEU|nr:hypothetical protein [Pseudonocardia eucalypti]